MEIDLVWLQRLIDPQPPEERELLLQGELACDAGLSERLRDPPWLEARLRQQLTHARMLADEVPFQAIRRRVVGVPVWLSLTEDGSDAEVELVLLLLDRERDWQLAVTLTEADACWCQATVRALGRRLVVPSRNYAPDVEMEARFGEYGVLFVELGWQVEALTAGGRVPRLLPPRPLPGPWCGGADLAMDPALLPDGLADWIEVRLAAMRTSP